MLVDAQGSVVASPIVIGDIQYPPNIEALWSDAELAAIGLRRLAPPFDAAAVNAEARRRIYAIASDDAQKNMMANAIAGNFSADDVTAWKNGVAWVSAMQVAARALIASADATYADDAHWPPVPADAAALAARY